MTTTSTATRMRLNRITLVIGIALTVLAIYDITHGERSTSEWIAIVCWPIVAIGSAVQLTRLRKL